MGDIYPKVRVAAIQAAPVFLNREATVEKACRLIREAGANGAQVIGFPEGYIPAHPIWFHYYPATNPKAVQFSTELFKNAVEVPSAATDALCQAARDASAYVVMGICERLPGTNGTMFNSQLFIDPAGRIIGKHEKLMPTAGERLVHTVGRAGTLQAVDTEFGPISGLICGENSNPLAIFSLTAQSSRIHVASWPYHFRLGGLEGQRMRDVTLIASQSAAYVMKAVVINACGTVDEHMIKLLAATEQDVAGLKDPANVGGSSIVSAGGRVVAGPMGPEEGILYADVDLEDGVRAKLNHDFAGHYNRPDIFQLNVSTVSSSIYNPVAAPSPALGWLADALEVPTFEVSSLDQQVAMRDYRAPELKSGSAALPDPSDAKRRRKRPPARP